jgi:toxin ParE1/3/4
VARVLWTGEALRNLTSIGRYLDETSPARRPGVIKTLYDACNGLGRFPNKGRRVREAPDRPFRELVVLRYRIVYEVRDDVVYVRMVFDAAMNARERLRYLRRGS